MLTATRHAHILATVSADGEVTVDALADRFGVSTSTIRRDLNALDAAGLLRRVRGGGSVERDPVPYAQTVTQRRDEKERIARRAAEEVADDDIVLIDIGATCALLARQLRGRRITVVTASLAVVDELRADDDLELIVLGGAVRKNYQSMVGAFAQQALAQIRASVCFLGTSGVQEDGSIHDSTPTEVPIKRAMLEASERRVVLADGAKFPGVSVERVCEAGSFDTLITDRAAPVETLDRLRSAGVAVVTV